MNTQFIDIINAQAIDSSLANCGLTTDTENIDLGNVNPITNPQVMITRNLSVQCDTRGYYGPDNTGRYTAVANFCIGILALNGTDSGGRVKKLFRQKSTAEGGGVDQTNALNFEIYNRVVGRTQAVGTGAIGGGMPIISGVAGENFTGPVPPIDSKRVSSSSVSLGMLLLEPPILNIPVGIYSNTFRYVIYSGVAIPNGGTSPGSVPDSSNGCVASFGVPQTLDFTVTANVVAGCSVTVKSVNFGDHVYIKSDLSQDGEISLKCNVNAPYEIKINGGQSGDVNARKMYLAVAGGTQDRSQSIPYHIYLPNTQTEWGETTNVNTYKGITSANDTAIKIRTVIRASEVLDPPNGTYSDQVSITTTY
ncbi:Csu type fimbrial protein [Bartonella sp. HY761]|uniref:Csu type fimbrial protein n=1 Tax=Bartonella sp. HY761 TaxID=2979330 RepID=UPI0021FDB12B|nr:spore coat U domain-containing protein [Bartonella sp. HY761]UXN08139.1 spore coat U domain-containing protein [Bartonella sp. HY761]